MHVVDSSGRLEYFAVGPNAGFFTAAIGKPADLVVPTISLYEVFTRVLQQRDHGAAVGEARATGGATARPDGKGR